MATSCMEPPDQNIVPWSERVVSLVSPGVLSYSKNVGQDASLKALRCDSLPFPDLDKGIADVNPVGFQLVAYHRVCADHRASPHDRTIQKHHACPNPDVVLHNNAALVGTETLLNDQLVLGAILVIRRCKRTVGCHQDVLTDLHA